MSTVKVKVKVSVLISHLEKALAEREERYKNQDKAQDKYEKEVEKYNLAVLKLLKAGKGSVEEASRNTYYERTKGKGKTMIAFNATVLLPIGSLPDEPECPDRYNEHSFRHEKQEIQQAIRVLKLTDDTYVSASTYASVAKYL